MSSTMFFSFLGSMLICMALIPLLMASAGRMHFLDVPGGRKGHAIPVAKVGGIALAAGAFTAMLLWAPKDHLILYSVLGGVVIVLFGMWDDRVGLHYSMKFLGQFVAAGIAVGLAGVQITAVPFLDEMILPGWLAIPLSLIVIVGMTNAVNLADGLDGLAGGLSLISFAGIAYLGYLAQEPLLVLLMVSILGGLLGFLRFNTYPARIFMGDAGSQFLGHYLGVAAILLTDSTRTLYSPLLALFIWGIPLLDTLGVIGQRLLEGRSPFIGDRNHIHYKLLEKGLTHRQAVTCIYVAHSVMVSCAFLLRWQSDAVLLGVYLGCVCAALLIFVRFSHQTSVPALLAKAVPVPEGDGMSIGKWPLTALEILVPLYLVASVALPREIPHDVGMVAAGLLVAVVGALVWARGRAWIVRAGLYVGSTCMMYYGEIAPRTPLAELTISSNVWFALLAGLVLLTIRSAGEDRFQTTPLDYLIVLLAAATPFLPDMTVGEVPVSVLTAKLIVLFFAFELLLHVRSSTVSRLGWVTAWMLGGLVVRAWWL